MASEGSRKLKEQEEGVVDATNAPSITVPSTEGEAAAVSDGYFSRQPHAPTSSSGYNINLNTVDLQIPAPPYTPPSHSLFPVAPNVSRTGGGGGSTTRLQIPQSAPPTHALHTNTIYNNSNNNNNNAATTINGTPVTPLSQHSLQSFETAQDLEKGSLKLKLTRSATYQHLKPFFSRSSEPLDGPAPTVASSNRKSIIITSLMFIVTIVLIMAITFGLMKWFN